MKIENLFPRGRISTLHNKIMTGFSCVQEELSWINKLTMTITSSLVQKKKHVSHHVVHKFQSCLLPDKLFGDTFHLLLVKLMSGQLFAQFVCIYSLRKPLSENIRVKKGRKAETGKDTLTCVTRS